MIPPAPTATHFSVVAAPTSTTAGTGFSVTVAALGSNGSTISGYTGTFPITTSDAAAAVSINYTFTSSDAGIHTFNMTLKTAGTESITAADTSNGSINGSTNETVTAGAASKLVFGQQPTAAVAGAAIAPAVTLQVVDAFGNLLTSDSTDQVTIAMGTNPGGGVLSGTTTATVSGGIATFGTLSISTAGTGYTLVAGLGSLTVTSASFNISTASTGGGSGTSPGTLVEGFESSDMWNIVGGGYRINAVRSTAAAHDGTYGLDQQGTGQWIYRSDAAAQVTVGDTLSVWLDFSGSADGRAYFAFGATATGTLSLVAAPNTGQFLIQQNVGFGFGDVAAVNQTFVANHWYRLEVDWGTSGAIVGKLFDSNGTTLLQTVSGATTAITSGGFGFRSIGSDKFWDTVTVSFSVNNFAVNNSANHTGSSNSGGGGSSTSSGSQGGGASAASSFFGGFSNPTSTSSGGQESGSLPWADIFGDFF